MKLITETTEDVRLVTEKTDDGKKNYFIEGVFMQAETKNRNGRVYPMGILEKEVQRYSKDLVEKKRALGELNHPQGPTVNLDKVSHLITELEKNGVNYVKDDFMLSAVDIVADPSAPSAFVNGIMEGAEWVWDNGVLKEKEISDMRRQIEATSRNNLEKTTLQLFERFMRNL